MKTLFVHDHAFKFEGDQFYSSGGLPSYIWSRYTSVFEQLTVVGRNGGSLAKQDKGFTLSSTARVRFALMPNISNIRSLVFGNADMLQVCKKLVLDHDAVIARLPSRLGNLFVEEAKRQSKPYAVEVVGCPWDALWNYGNLKGKLFAPYAAWEHRRILSKAAYVLYVTESFLQARYPAPMDAVTVFCSNVEIPAVANNVLSARINKINNSSLDDEVNFGLVANYSASYKGIDVAIKALAEAKLPKWRLQIVGKGNPSLYRAIAKDLGVESNIDFVGSLPSGKAVFDWLDNVDIYLQPSFVEGLPRALIEAMSRGCPALASNIAGIPELLDESAMIKVGDFEGLSQKITNLASDVDNKKLHAQKNFNKAKSYYKDVLDGRRAEFLRRFKSSIEG